MGDKDSQKYYQKAINMLSRREYSVLQIRQALERQGADSLLIDDLIQQLEQDNYISDERYTESYLRSYFQKGHGPIKIRHSLEQAGVNSSVITELLYHESFDWFESAKEARVKKFGALIPDDFKDKAKQMRFLYSRGFTNEQIEYALERK